MREYSYDEPEEDQIWGFDRDEDINDGADDTPFEKFCRETYND